MSTLVFIILEVCDESGFVVGILLLWNIFTPEGSYDGILDDGQMRQVFCERNAQGIRISY
jgi:hypothetical protein